MPYTHTTTPLMRQYQEMKAKYPGSLLLFRVGDFYETFEEDAVKASKVLDIVLTKRANGSAAAVQLAGFPYHSLDTYLPKLIKAGFRVAVCDQLEDPKMAKGLVKRGVTELVTPGLSFHDAVLDRKQNNYLASLYFEKDVIGIAFLDVSTGDFLTAQGNALYVEKLVQSFQPAEVILSKKQQHQFQSLFKEDYPSYSLEEWVYQLDYGTEMLRDHFGTASIKQIAHNIGMKFDESQYGGDMGLNAKTQSYSNLRKDGIIEPYDVFKYSVTNAFSIAIAILTSGYFIVNKIEKDDK